MSTSCRYRSHLYYIQLYVKNNSRKNDFVYLYIMVFIRHTRRATRRHLKGKNLRNLYITREYLITVK